MNHSKNFVLNFIFAIAFLFVFDSGIAQENLVPNPGFDTYTNCVTTLSQSDLTPPWKTPYDQSGTPDYMNSCYPGSDKEESTPKNYYGYQEPISGKGYYGMITYYAKSEVREYLGAPLTSQMEKGKTYLVGCFVSKADHFPYAIDQFGIHVSDGRVAGEGELEAMTEFEPQISNPKGEYLDNNKGWVQISGRYTATGDEDYITIGNFADDENTGLKKDKSAKHENYGYYYVDNVFVIAIEDSAEYVQNLHSALNSIVLEMTSVPDLTAAGSEGHGEKYIDMPHQLIHIRLKIDGSFKTLEVLDDDNLTYMGINIYDEDGDIVAQELPESGVANHKFVIENLKNGNYYIEVFTKERKFKRTKFVIDR